MDSGSNTKTTKVSKVIIIDDYANDPDNFVSYSSADDVTSSDDQGTLGDVTVDPQVIGHRHESDVGCLSDEDDDQITAAQYSASSDPDFVDLTVYDDMFDDQLLLDIRNKKSSVNTTSDRPLHGTRQRYDSMASHASEDEIAAAQYRAAADPDYVDFTVYDDYIDDQFCNQRKSDAEDEIARGRREDRPAGDQVPKNWSAPAGSYGKPQDLDLAYAGSDYQNLGQDNTADILKGGRAH